MHGFISCACHTALRCAARFISNIYIVTTFAVVCFIRAHTPSNRQHITPCGLRTHTRVRSDHTAVSGRGHHMSFCSYAWGLVFLWTWGVTWSAACCSAGLVHREASSHCGWSSSLSVGIQSWDQKMTGSVFTLVPPNLPKPDHQNQSNADIKNTTIYS